MDNNKTWQLALLALAGALMPGMVMAKETCLNGYELTAIVVLETDIKHSVESSLITHPYALDFKYSEL